MKIIKFLSLALFALLFSQCKTTAPTAPASSSAPLLESGRTLDAIQTQLLLYADSTNGDARAALIRTGNWLKGQPDIQSVSVLDSSYLYFTLQSGWTSVFYLDELDANGMSLTRGGNGGGGALYHWDALSVNKITNPSILFFSPTFKEFNTEAHLQAVRDLISNAGLGLTLTVKRDAECTTDVVDHMGDYGVVILDTHGLPNAFLTGHKILDTITAAFLTKGDIGREINSGTVAYDKFQAGTVMLGRGLSFTPAPGWQKTIPKPATDSFRVILTSKYLLGLPKLPGTVIFGNMCYSGWSQPVPPNTGFPYPIQKAFLGLNPISYYGYAFATSGFSARVSNEFAGPMTDSLLKQLLTNTDSTGHSHLQKNGTEYYDIPGLEDGFSDEKNFLKHWGADNYSYQKCGDTLVDARDGQKYATVCIGKQVWMAENLRYNASGSVCYDDKASNCDIYGRMYDWQTVMAGASATSASPSGVQGICPKGWHIPSEGEWTTLINTVGGTDLGGAALRSTKPLWIPPNTGASNSSGFSALPSGEYANAGGWKYIGLGEIAFWWTTTLGNQAPLGAVWIKIYDNNPNVYINHNGVFQQDHFSCRCLKD